jgi:hypothetical protein
MTHGGEKQTFIFFNHLFSQVDPSYVAALPNQLRGISRTSSIGSQLSLSTGGLAQIGCFASDNYC